MFERDKKSHESSGSKDTFVGQQAEKSSLSGASGYSKDVAVIGSSIQINGDLRGDEDLRIEGNVSGTVKLKNSSLTIGKGGKIKAGVYAKSIAVDGETTGDLHATECVSVHANARVQGNIIAPRVSIVEGAHFKGSIEMDPDAVKKALGDVSTSSPTEPGKTATAADPKPPPKSPAKEANDTPSRPRAKSA